MMGGEESQKQNAPAGEGEGGAKPE